jgi:hypothetical protein
MEEMKKIYLGLIIIGLANILSVIFIDNMLMRITTITVITIIGGILIHKGRTEISNQNKYINLKDVNVDMVIELKDALNTSSFIRSITQKNSNFKIWITFSQDGVIIDSYLDSFNNWKLKDTQNKPFSYEKSFVASYSDDELLIHKSNLIVEKKFPNTSEAKLRSDKKVYFKIHYSGTIGTFKIRNYKMKMVDGMNLTPKQLSDKKSDLINPLNDTSFHEKKYNTVALSGYFKN